MIYIGNQNSIWRKTMDIGDIVYYYEHWSNSLVKAKIAEYV